jgi:two-component system, NarL family, invasion response regulator UvrY
VEPHAPVRVLVADDQLPFRKAARAVLDVLPEFELVEEVGSGEAAVDAAVSLEPDLVLMDVQMEGIGGIEAARRILAARPETLVVLVSSHRAEDVAAAAADSGAAMFVAKDKFGARTLSELWAGRAELLARRGTGGPPSLAG